MNLNKFFHWSYLWQRYTPVGFSWPMRIGLLVLLVGAIALAVYWHRKIKNCQGPQKSLAKKIRAWGFTSGIIGLLLVWFREIQAMYLGSRLLLSVWLIIMIAWLISILIYRFKDLPKKQAALQQQAEFNKWLPQNKK